MILSQLLKDETYMYIHVADIGIVFVSLFFRSSF